MKEMNYKTKKIIAIIASILIGTPIAIVGVYSALKLSSITYALYGSNDVVFIILEVGLIIGGCVLGTFFGKTNYKNIMYN